MLKLCILGGILCGAVLCQGLLSFEQIQNTVCSGDDFSYLATCGTGAVIAVNDILAGAKRSSKKCPTYYNATADPSCCQFEDSDCTMTFGAYYNWYSGCSGREQCNQPGAQNDVTNADSCGQDHLAIFGPVSQYLLMDYYCIESSILHGVCSDTSRSYTGKTEFLTSPSYPANIPSSNTDCTCSVEVDDCDARIQIHTLHLELSETDGVCGQQSFIITDGLDVQTLTCADNSFQGISVKETATNYINLQLLNSEQTDSGRFWLGFTASVNSSNMEINCPPQAQKTTCMTTSSSTTTTTSSSKPSTSTTSTVEPTTTTHSATKSTTTQSSTIISTVTSSTVTASTVTSSPTPSTPTTSTAAPTTTTQSVTSPMIIKSSTILSPAHSTGSTPTSTTSIMKVASETNDDKENVVLTTVIVIMACVLVVLIIATIVYCCFVRRRFKKMDIEVADLKKKVSGSQIHLPNEHSGLANNCIKNKHQNTAADTYNTYDETGSMIKGNKESIIEENKFTSSLSKTVPLVKTPSAAKQLWGQKKEKVEGGSKYRSTMKSRTKTKPNETGKQLNKQAGPKQERHKTFKNYLSERLHISKPLKSDNLKNDQSTKIDVASESLDLDEKKESKPSISIRNGKIRPQSRAKSKRLEEPKTPSAKSMRCKRLLKRKIPAKRIIKKTLLEPNIMIQNEVEPAKTDKSVEENSCIRDPQKYENDLKTVVVKVDLPQKSGQVNSEDNTRKHDLDINIPIQNMSQIVSDEMKVQVASSNSNGAMHIQRQETETFVCKNVSKRKRYLRLHKILSSALGYSWSYKEVPKKMKLSKLDSKEINIAPKVFRVELKQGKFLVSETCDNFARHDGEITAPLSKIKLGIHDTEDTRSEKITIKKKRKKQRRFKATRIFPKSCPGMKDSSVTQEKAKAHNLKRCHWTHSKF